MLTPIDESFWGWEEVLISCTFILSWAWKKQDLVAEKAQGKQTNKDTSASLQKLGLNVDKEHQ